MHLCRTHSGTTLLSYGYRKPPYGIRVVPTLILECNGKIIEHYIGVTRPEILEADLNKAAESCTE